MVGGRESKCWQSRSPPRETKPSREVSREESVEPLWSVLAQAVLSTGGKARWSWRVRSALAAAALGEIWGPQPPIGGPGDRRRASPASNDVPPSLLARPSSPSSSSGDLNTGLGSATHTNYPEPGIEQAECHPSIHPSSPSPSRLIDVHLPTAPIQGIIKKALAFSVP